MSLIISLMLPAGAATLANTGAHDALNHDNRAVLRGVVRDVELEPTQARLLHTRYLIDVEEVLAGTHADQVTVVLPGGRVGDMAQVVSGVPMWSEGDEVLVFVPRSRQVSMHDVMSIDDGLVIDLRPDSLLPGTVSELERQLARERSQ